jgi:hypothetical protein
METIMDTLGEIWPELVPPSSTEPDGGGPLPTAV